VVNGFTRNDATNRLEKILCKNLACLKEYIYIRGVFAK
jgi:hypothetical protein